MWEQVARPRLRMTADLTIDVGAREVRVSDDVIDLTKIEFDILDALSSEPGTVLTRAELIERVWGQDWFGDEHVVDVHLSNLRKKLGDDPREPRYVVTVRSVGFRFVA